MTKHTQINAAIEDLAREIVQRAVAHSGGRRSPKFRSLIVDGYRALARTGHGRIDRLAVADRLRSLAWRAI